MTDLITPSDRRLPFARTEKLNPPEELAQWREELAMQQITLWNGTQAWVALTYEAVRAVFKDHERYRSQPATPAYPTINQADSASKASKLMPMVDPPVHTALREAVLREFILRRIDALRPETGRVVSTLLDDIARTGSPTDLVSSLAGPVPAPFHLPTAGGSVPGRGVILRLPRRPVQPELRLDIRLRRRRRAARVLPCPGVTQRLADAVPRNGVLRDDMAGRLVEQSLRTGKLSQEDAAALLHVLLIGGFDTTKQMIAVGVLTLLRNPDQRALLDADPSKWRLAVQELLRYITVAQIERRACVEDTEICGQLVRAGEGVLVMHARPIAIRWCSQTRTSSTSSARIHPTSHSVSASISASVSRSPGCCCRWRYQRCVNDSPTCVWRCRTNSCAFAKIETSGDWTSYLWPGGSDDGARI
jgi:cytochrome P450